METSSNNVGVNKDSVEYKKFANEFLKNDSRRIILESVLKEQKFTDEILIPFYVNGGNTKENRKKFGKLYDRLVEILKDDTVYDYGESFLDDTTQKVKHITNFKQIPLFNYNNTEVVLKAIDEFQSYIGELESTSYRPSLNILNLSQRHLSLYLKHFPKESTWVREMRDRIEFYGYVIRQSNSLKLTIRDADLKYKEYTKLYNNIKRASLSEAKKVYMYQQKNIKENSMSRINGLIGKLNTFGTSGGTVYGDRSISSSIKLIEALESDGYLNTLMSMESRLRNLLKDSISK